MPSTAPARTALSSRATVPARVDIKSVESRLAVKAVSIAALVRTYEHEIIAWRRQGHLMKTIAAEINAVCGISILTGRKMSKALDQLKRTRKNRRPKSVEVIVEQTSKNIGAAKITNENIPASKPDSDADPQRKEELREIMKVLSKANNNDMPRREIPGSVIRRNGKIIGETSI